MTKPAPDLKPGGTKHDSGKPMVSLLDSEWLLGTAAVLTFGAKKYAPHNWRQGFPYSRVMDALQRHLLAFNGGQDLDEETGLSHLYHASCCLMFLSSMKENHPELDDRYKKESASAVAVAVEVETPQAVPPIQSEALIEKKAPSHDNIPRPICVNTGLASSDCACNICESGRVLSSGYRVFSHPERASCECASCYSARRRNTQY